MRNLADLKAAKAEITELRNTIRDLSNDHAQLRIKLATSRERQQFLVLEIPIGILSGFAINMLVAAKFASGLGWALFVLSLVMFLSVGTVSKVGHLFAKEEDRDGEKEN